MSSVPREQVETFGRDGFVVVPDLLGDEELARFGPAVDAGVSRRKAGDTRPLADKTRYEQSFQQCINLWEDCADVRPLTFHPRIARAAAELIGAPALRVWHDQALYKEAGGRETDPHQDHPYWPIRETDNLTAWIPLDGTTHENGCLGYLPGSHRLGIRKFANIFSGTSPERFLEAPELRGIEPVFVEVPRGAVAFHHGLTVHLSRPNRSGRMRRIHTVIYFRDGSTRSAGHGHFAVDRPGIAVGERIESDVTPVAWPRQEGDLPVPPPLLEHGGDGTLPSRETL